MNRRPRDNDDTFGLRLQNIDWSMHKANRLVSRPFHEVSPECRELDPKKVEKFRKMLNITVSEADTANPILSFAQANLPGFIEAEMERSGLTKPFPIQAQAMPVAFTGRNLIGVAATGSGKTLAFLIPAILLTLKLKEQGATNSSPTVVVLSPTRELAQQIHSEFHRFTAGVNVSAACLYGGTRRLEQRQQLQRGVDIAIGTPGRVIDFLQDGAVHFRNAAMLIVDEADRMLDMGFEKQLRKINSQVNPDRQTLFFTATWPREVEALAADFVHKPARVTVGSLDTAAVHSVTQRVRVLDRRDKFSVLMEDIVAAELSRGGKVLVFASTRRVAEFLFEQVRGAGGQALLLHGGKSQDEREFVLGQFIVGKCSVLVATDVAQRGLDIPNITCVVNYDFPTQIEDYVHRIGRTGRAGKGGVAWTLFTRDDEAMARSLIRVLEEADQEVPEPLKEIADSGPDVDIERVFPKPWGERTESEREEFESAPIQMALENQMAPEAEEGSSFDNQIDNAGRDSDRPVHRNDQSDQWRPAREGRPVHRPAAAADGGSDSEGGQSEIRRMEAKLREYKERIERRKNRY